MAHNSRKKAKVRMASLGMDKRPPCSQATPSRHKAYGSEGAEWNENSQASAHHIYPAFPKAASQIGRRSQYIPKQRATKAANTLICAVSVTSSNGQSHSVSSQAARALGSIADNILVPNRLIRLLLLAGRFAMIGGACGIRAPPHGGVRPPTSARPLPIHG
ncbi:hypothetical protein LR69_03601 [Geobacillus sp. BCO2]|nr:hypothetical protein LR69_03601 [Geobacillus sp. BCO2]